MTATSPDRIKQLLSRRLEGTLDPLETDELWQYVLNPENRVYIESLLGEEFAHLLQPEDLLPAEQDEMIRSILDHDQFKLQPVRQRRLWRRIAIAAAVATIIFGAGLFYYNLNYNYQQSDQVALKNDVAPGKSGATLTLANGKKIRLSDAVNGELANESGVAITKSQNGELVYEIKGSSDKFSKINTLTTAKGETYQLRLPDGSLVWLNSASSLTYSASLMKDGKRSVKLTGEGYFEIAKDKAHPFIVEAAGQQVEVLGTHFNVNAYTDEPVVATTLLEGAVKVASGSVQKTLVPGEQARNRGGQLTVTKVDTESIVDWKEGDFNLQNVDFRTAMRKIARWYDVEVVYDKSVPEAIEAGGWISRNSKLSSILKLIENSGLVKFKIEGKKVYVYR